MKKLMSTEFSPISGFIKSVAAAADKHQTQRREDAEAFSYITLADVQLRCGGDLSSPK